MLRPPTVILAISDLGQYCNAFLAFTAYFALVSGCKFTKLFLIVMFTHENYFIVHKLSQVCHQVIHE